MRWSVATGWVEMGGARFAEEKPDADGGSLGARGRDGGWVVGWLGYGIVIPYPGY